MTATTFLQLKKLEKSSNKHTNNNDNNLSKCWEIVNKSKWCDDKVEMEKHTKERKNLRQRKHQKIPQEINENPCPQELAPELSPLKWFGVFGSVSLNVAKDLF